MSKKKEPEREVHDLTAYDLLLWARKMRSRQNVSRLEKAFIIMRRRIWKGDFDEPR